jgi:aminoglycoside phosphotransferase (APT) family kinase protein
MGPDIFAFIDSSLRERGITLQAESAAQHPSQGFMSVVYRIESSDGPYIVHVLDPILEHKREGLQKIPAVLRLLEKYPHIPAPRLAASGEIVGKVVLVTKYIPGSPAGSREFARGDMVDTWDDTAVVPHVQKILALTHGVHVEGYGWPTMSGGVVRAPHDTWESFLTHEFLWWSDNIQQADAGAGLPSVDESARRYMDAVVPRLGSAPGVLVHGDAVNPGNILVENGEITGLLDWEWSLVGDPAWEFCSLGGDTLMGEPQLAAYAKERAMSVSELQEFTERVHAYRPMWLLWATSVHARHQNLGFYKALRKLLEKELKNFFERF